MIYTLYKQYLNNYHSLDLKAIFFLYCNQVMGSLAIYNEICIILHHIITHDAYMVVPISARADFKYSMQM